MSNPYGALRESFPADDHPCILSGGDTVTYRMAEDRTACLAGGLVSLGVGKGDIVALLTDKSVEAMLLYLALGRIGAVFLPVHVGLASAEIAHILADAAPRLVICDPRFVAGVSGGPCRVETMAADGQGSFLRAAEAAEPVTTLASCGAQDPNALVYTSGTTGRPKGAWITHAQVIWNVRAIRDMWQIGPGDVLLHLNLMAYGVFATMLPMLAAGGSIRLVRDASVPTILSELPGATMMASVPTVYQRLLAEPEFTRDFCRNMRLFITGSAPMREDLFAEFEARTGHQLLDRYGMTEALLITSNRAEGRRVPGNSGYPLGGSRLRIVDAQDEALPAGEVGRIEISQPAPFAGYLNAPDKTAEAFAPDGWLRTGDFGSLDAEGRLNVIGRGSDLIITGGLNVYPKEVEQILNTHPAVAESAVIGIPHPEYGEAVFAVVELGPDAPERFDPDEQRRLLRGTIAGYKIPKHIEIVREMPRNALGKIKKQELRTRFANFFRPKGD